MKEKHFSTIEAHRIIQLIKKKNNVNAEARAKVIEEIKRAGFDHSVWNLQEDFTESQFKAQSKISLRSNRRFVSEKWFLIVLLCLLPFLFKKSFENFIDTIVVKPILSDFNAGTFADIIFLSFIIGSAGWLIYWKVVVKRIVDWLPIIMLSIIAVYVGLYRFRIGDFAYWMFMPLHNWTRVTYLDSFLILPLLLFIYKIAPTLKVGAINTPDPDFKMYNDTHINTIGDDVIKRSELAEYLAKHIVNTNTDLSFAIGVHAKWGDGKTSFQKLVSEYLYEYDREILIMEFNPWKSCNEQQIVDDFFIGYATLLKQYDFGLGDRLVSYAKTLTAENNSWWSGIIGFFHEFGSHGAQFDEIDERLLKVNKKVVVFIDDLDRLSTDEIMELFKLIRNSANFRNTFFIVGFDRDYLQEALAKRSRYGQHRFLEKIFQLQLDLSHIPDGLIRDTLKASLLDRLKDYTEQIELLFSEKKEAITTVSDIFEGKITSFHFVPGVLTNLRDIKRFANFFSISVRLVGNEVVFEEYFYVALLRFKFPLLLSRIKRNRLDCFKSDLPASGLPYKVISEEKIKELCTNGDIEKLDTRDQDLVCKILVYLLSGNDSDRRSVIHPDKFDLYFDNSLNTQQLLFSEFVPLLNKNWSEIEYQIKQWIDEGKAAYIMEILGSINPYSNTERTEKVARIWVLLINRNQYVEMSTQGWLKLIGDKQKLHLFGLDGPVHLVRDLFNTKSHVFFYITYILRLVLRKYIDGIEHYFPLSKTECQKIVVDRLKEFTASRSEFDRRVLEFFYYDCWESKQNGSVVLLKEANEVVLKHIDKYPAQYLRFTLRPMGTPNIDNEYTFEPFTPQYFGSWDAFEEFLKKTIQDTKGDSIDVSSGTKTSRSEFDPMLEYYKQFKDLGHKPFKSEEAPPWIELDKETLICTLIHFKNQTYDTLLKEYQTVK